MLSGLDKWQDKISSGFDRLVAFASTELDKRRRSTEGSVINGNCSSSASSGGLSANTSPDSGIGHGDAPAAPPPRLYRPDSPPSLEDPPRTPSPSSPPPPLLPFSPAPLDGPYSPVPHSSPPHLPPSMPVGYQKEESDRHFKKKFFHNKKFRPKNKSWDWHHVQEEGQEWC